jgi:hypothetical protein
MNERIRLLAEQAKLQPYYDAQEGQIQKFAELIVRECVRVAKLTEADDGDDYKSGRQWAGFDILQHFGVKE